MNKNYKQEIENKIKEIQDYQKQKDIYDMNHRKLCSDKLIEFVAPHIKEGTLKKLELRADLDHRFRYDGSIREKYGTIEFIFRGKNYWTSRIYYTMMNDEEVYSVGTSSNTANALLREDSTDNEEILEIGDISAILYTMGKDIVLRLVDDTELKESANGYLNMLEHEGDLKQEASKLMEELFGQGIKEFFEKNPIMTPANGYTNFNLGKLNLTAATLKEVDHFQVILNCVSNRTGKILKYTTNVQEVFDAVTSHKIEGNLGNDERYKNIPIIPKWTR